MTQMECEMALIKLAEAAGEIVKMYDPEINHVSITVNADGYIGIRGAEFEDLKMVRSELLDASKYDDGHIRFGVKEASA